MSIKKFIIKYYRVVLANLRSRHWLGTIVRQEVNFGKLIQTLNVLLDLFII